MKPIPATPILVLFLLVIFIQQCFSQDQIILNSGDTINCTIGKMTNKFIFYSQNSNGISAKGKIRKDHIRDWYYSTAKENTHADIMLPDGEKEIQEQETVAGMVHTKQERIRISIYGGPAYMLGNTEKAEETLQGKGVHVNDAKNYYDQIKLGYQTKSSLYIHAFGEYWLGALYHGFHTNAEITTPMLMDDVYMYYGKLEDRIFVNFAGISLFSATRYGKSKQIGINSSFTTGPAFYRDEAELLNDQILIKGTSLATQLSFGLEYFIKPDISLSLDLHFFPRG